MALRRSIFDGQASSSQSLLGRAGRQIRDVRTSRKWTLQDLSDASGVSIGVLSGLERGQGNPSFNTLVQVAHALDISVAALLQEGDSRPPSPVVRHDQRRQLQIHAGDPVDAIHQLLTPDLNRALQVIWVETQPGHSTERYPSTHAGEEVGVVLQGTDEVHVDGETYVLHAGDTISFASTLPHWFRSPGPDVVKAVWVVTPPTF